MPVTVGLVAGDEFFVNTVTQHEQSFGVGTMLSDGNFLAGWNDYSWIAGDGSRSAVKAQLFQLAGTKTGTAGDDTLIGSGLKNEITGLAGNDRLDGGENSNKLTGGLGDDISMVDAGDQVIELGGEGTDTAETALFNYTLDANVENLVITGLDAANVNGNELDNVITGNAGRNVIFAGAGNDTIYSNGGDDYFDGGAGADTFHGGSGNNGYVFDDAGDTVTGEVAGGGTDSIWTSVTADLNQFGAVENLRLTGTGSINGTGNALNNLITGNAGDNVIAGGAGVDSLYGKGGADTFHFDAFGVANKDSIWDFDGDDKISLDGAVFAGLDVEDGHVASTSFVNGTAATTPGKATIIYTAWSGILAYDADGQGGAGSVEIAFIGKNLSGFDGGDILIA